MDRAFDFVVRSLGCGRNLTVEEWQRILDFADRTQMTLLLRDAPGLPDWMVREIDVRRVKNAQRVRHLEAAYTEVSVALASQAVDFVFLKGFSHRAFGLNPLDRVQYDIDILCKPYGLRAAQSVLQELGYAAHSARSLSDDHLPPFVKPHSWAWRHDYFDPDMPIAIELHTQVWNSQTDRIHLAGPDLFWNHRQRNPPQFCLPDRVAYAALHVLRHILRNDARPAHVFELACFLQTHSDNATFWREWQHLHDPALRQAQAIAFRFATEWFRCNIPEQLAQEMAQLSSPVRAWFEEFAWSPVTNIVRPNKHVLWLHVALVDSLRDKALVLRRRALPLHMSRTHGATTLNRLRHHARMIAPLLASACRWWRRCVRV